MAAPIVGTSSLEKLHDTISMFPSYSIVLLIVDLRFSESVHVKLTEEEVKYLEEPYMPRNVVGHW